MIRVFLVDDHPVVRAGVRFILERSQAIQVVGEASTGKEALEKIDAAAVDVVVLDISLPDIDGIACAEKLAKKHPSLKLLALSMHEEPEYAERFLAAGGAGYLGKSSIEYELVDAVKALARGEHFVPQSLLYAMIQNKQKNPLPEPELLTERERSVVRGIARGLTYKQIARELGISEKTVATYRERAAAKLGLASRAALTRWALKVGLLDGE